MLRQPNTMILAAAAIVVGVLALAIWAAFMRQRQFDDTEKLAIRKAEDGDQANQYCNENALGVTCSVGSSERMGVPMTISAIRLHDITEPRTADVMINTDKHEPHQPTPRRGFKRALCQPKGIRMEEAISLWVQKQQQLLNPTVSRESTWNATNRNAICDIRSVSIAVTESITKENTPMRLWCSRSEAIDMTVTNSDNSSRRPSHTDLIAPVKASDRVRREKSDRNPISDIGLHLSLSQIDDLGINQRRRDNGTTSSTGSQNESDTKQQRVPVLSGSINDTESNQGVTPLSHIQEDVMPYELSNCGQRSALDRPLIHLTKFRRADDISLEQVTPYAQIDLTL
ncbi:unnamed protein product [Dicrocoelium dendriticum]|nr:unnamed protein product [Dicrocoelium dendriticum]